MCASSSLARVICVGQEKQHYLESSLCLMFLWKTEYRKSFILVWQHIHWSLSPWLFFIVSLVINVCHFCNPPSNVCSGTFTHRNFHSYVSLTTLNVSIAKLYKFISSHRRHLEFIRWMAVVENLFLFPDWKESWECLGCLHVYHSEPVLNQLSSFAS